MPSRLSAARKQVLEYLGRYTHRVALSNQRLLNIDNDQVPFRYKNCRLKNNERAATNTTPKSTQIPFDSR